MRDARGLPQPVKGQLDAEQLEARALRRALAEHDLSWHTIMPGEPISGQLVSRRQRKVLVCMTAATTNR